jgi:hypothetical protein
MKMMMMKKEEEESVFTWALANSAIVAHELLCKTQDCVNKKHRLVEAHQYINGREEEEALERVTHGIWQ